MYVSATLLIHPTLSPTVPTSLFLYVCVSITALQIGYSVPFSLHYILCINIWYLSFFFWPNSLHIKGSRFIHLTRTDTIPCCVWVIFNCIYIYIYTTSSLSIYLLMDIQVVSCPGCCKRCYDEHQGACVFSYGSFISSFLRNPHIVLHSGYINLHPHQ